MKELWELLKAVVLIALIILVIIGIAAPYIAATYNGWKDKKKRKEEQREKDERERRILPLARYFHKPSAFALAYATPPFSLA
ncbi:hypothetical protein ES705_32699 [subsurface metagenome]